jgi:putative ABC transport system permease protein
VKRAADGKPILCAKALASVAVTKRSTGLDAFVVARGIGPEGFALRPEIRLINGRMFHPATQS